MDLLHWQRCHSLRCRAAYATWPQSEIRSIKDLWGILLFFAPLDADLLAQRHQIEIHPPAVSTPSEKIERCIVL
ncbi:hypothetical protein [Reticulibacter mediterranei]|uniref:hypothetical protein n=1 Tax=Reticulibacter mediterranei TaxID=2778369 RepID=UPI001C693F81|nr:hypothetical protein [Reticulibacter mediterranei]